MPGLERALPAAAILRRFDTASIEPALPKNASERERLMLAFAEQEWIDVAQGEAPATMVLEIEPRLLPARAVRLLQQARPEWTEAEDALRGRLHTWPGAR